MSKHTPGPWAAQEREGLTQRWRIHAPESPATGGNTRTIAYIGTPASYPRPKIDAENEANARLIAAAPEMYAALVALTFQCADGKGCWCLGPGTDEHDESCRLARAAIAKVEGGAR